jgi:hypothetical protein
VSTPKLGGQIPKSPGVSQLGWVTGVGLNVGAGTGAYEPADLCYGGVRWSGRMIRNHR